MSNQEERGAPRARVLQGRGVRLCGACVAAVLLALIIALTQSGAATPITKSFSPVADAPVRADQAQKNFGGATVLKADASPVIRSYLRFDVREVGGTITRAVLRVHANAASSVGYDVRGVTSNTWTERGITYSNAPPVGAVIGRSGALARGVTEVDVTPLVTGPGLVSLALTTTSTAVIDFASRESSTLPRPELVLETTDTQPPETSIASGPAGTVSATTASFGFSASEAGSSFECALDGADFATCSSPKQYSGLAQGSHTFRVRATDAAGNVDPTPASRTWVVDGAPPETSLTSGPFGTVSATTASFGFSASEASSSFECALDEEAFATCSSPKQYAGLADGSHTFRVRAIDAAGNVDTTPASRTWVIADGAPPETTIESGPAGTYRLSSADFTFSSDSGATFECRLDEAEFEPCGASPTFHVANGSHQLDVRAVDGSGRADPTPARREWWADALLANGNFETSSRGWDEQGFAIAGWKPHGAAGISLVNGGNAGRTAGRLSATDSGPLSMYSTPHAIDSTVAGDTYTLSGKFRSDQPGQTVCLRLREWVGGSVVATKQNCKTTSSSWAEFTPVTLAITTAGSQLGVDVRQATPPAPGHSFDVDGIALRDGKSPSVPEPPPEEGDPTLLAAGDVASCWSSGDEAVSRLLDTMAGTIAIPGDTEQNHGSPHEFDNCYDPSWGRHRARTMPAVGDHEYHTPGATGYFDYFGAAAGEPGKGWYSYDLGAWHIVVLNSNCSRVGGCGQGSEQYEWLRADLDRNGGDCIGAYWHHPLFSSGSVHGGVQNSRPFWDLLYRHRAEWVLSGNDHSYQRFAPQTPAGDLDPERGVRQFVVGTGGTRLDALGAPLPNTQVQGNSAFGLLRLGLHLGSYDWQFVPQEGKAFTDSGSTACTPHGDADPPETTIDEGPNGTVGSNAVSFGFSSDEPGAGFRCSLDDQAFTPCSSPQRYANLAEGQHVFRVKAVDAGGNEDDTPASRTWTVAANNLLPNGSFEGSLNGWFGYQAVLSLQQGGPEGLSFARVASDGSGPPYTINTTPRPVSSSEPGRTYQASGWIRSETPGKRVCIHIRERVNGSVVKNTVSCRTATSNWERFAPASHTAVGGGSLEVYSSHPDGVAGESFDIDGVSLVVLP